MTRLMPDERRQVLIEREVGIDIALGKYINELSSPAAQTAMDALRLAVIRYEPGAMGILRAAVADCRREMEALTGAAP